MDVVKEVMEKAGVTEDDDHKSHKKLFEISDGVCCCSHPAL